MSVKIESPPIRACLFDMDGLLINTEDMYTLCANHVLAKYNRPPLPWSIKAKLMGVPGGSTSSVFIDWAQLPISKEQYALEQREQQKLHFPSCKPLPGVEKLLKDLSTARDVEGNKVHIALATSSEKYNFGLKTSKEETRRLLEVLEKGERSWGRSKSREGLAENEEPIRPEECLVFEDSVPGVEAGRRAGMKVVWVPHEGLLAEYKGQEKKVLAGRMGMRIGDEEQLGQIDDGWGQLLPNLEDFPYETYGIVVS
ncbi:hypothetical protein H4I96_01227 [Botrytis cinerea]